MPMLKEDETVVSRGFAATCKTKCVDLEGDELYKYCLSHCKRRPGWIEKKPFDPKEWERKTLENVEKNRELNMQNFCYCDYQLAKPDQIVVPIPLPDENQISHGTIAFEKNPKARYKVDDAVIEDEDGKLHQVLIENKSLAKLHRRLDFASKKKMLERIILISTGTFSNPIQINIIAGMYEKKVIIDVHLRSSHKINVVEVRLSEIKEK